MLTRRTRILADRRKGRIIWPPWQKPPRGALLNRSHPLARKLIRAWILNEGSGSTVFEYVKNRKATITGASWTSGQGGIGLDIQSNEYVQCANAPSFEVGVCDQSMFAIVDLDTLSGGHELFCYGNFWSTGYVYWHTYWSSSTLVIEQPASAIYYENLMQTGYHSYAFEVPAYGIYTRSWRDGKLITISDDTFTMGNAGANDEVTFGNFYQATYNEPLAGRIFCLYWFYGFLTDGEVRQLHYDPYAMFQRERRVSILTPLSKFWPEDVASLRYSRGNYSTLPTDDADLEDDFEGKDYEAVEADDNVYVLQPADGEYAVFEFKEQHTNKTDPIAATWKGKTTLSTVSSSVYLQVFNHKQQKWVTIDTESTVAANVEFTLEGSLS